MPWPSSEICRIELSKSKFLFPTAVSFVDTACRRQWEDPVGGDYRLYSCNKNMTRSRIFFFETVSYAWRFLVKGQLPNVAAAAFAAQRGHYKVTAIRAHHKSLLQVFEVHFENFFPECLRDFFHRENAVKNEF